jgi:hypothetical protein
MQNEAADSADTALEQRSRALFQDSVEGVDFAMRSRLTRARHAALLAAAGPKPRGRFIGVGMWKPVAGVAAAALLGVALWYGPLSGSLSGNHGVTNDSQNNLDDLDIVASSDPGSVDAIDMLQDDLDFYDFANKAANAGPAA